MGTRLGGVWGELVENSLLKYSYRVLSLARVFCILFEAMSKSMSNEAFKVSYNRFNF